MRTKTFHELWYVSPRNNLLMAKAFSNENLTKRIISESNWWNWSIICSTLSHLRLTRQKYFSLLHSDLVCYQKKYWCIRMLNIYWPCIYLCLRWKALPMSVAGLRMEVCQEWWIDAALQETHGCQTIQMRSLRKIICQERSLGIAHETSSTEITCKIICYCTFFLKFFFMIWKIERFHWKCAIKSYNSFFITLVLEGYIFLHYFLTKKLPFEMIWQIVPFSEKSI